MNKLIQSLKNSVLTGFKSGNNKKLLVDDTTESHDDAEEEIKNVRLVLRKDPTSSKGYSISSAYFNEEMMNIEKYPKLDVLFTTYFHRRWTQEYLNAEAAILAFSHANETGDLMNALREIEALKKEFPDDEKLKSVLLDDFHLGYLISFKRRGITGEQWLDLVSSIIKEDLGKRSNS